MQEVGLGYDRCSARVCEVLSQGMRGAQPGYAGCSARVCEVLSQGMRGAGPGYAGCWARVCRRPLSPYVIFCLIRYFKRRIISRITQHLIYSVVIDNGRPGMRLISLEILQKYA